MRNGFWQLDFELSIKRLVRLQSVCKEEARMARIISGNSKFKTSTLSSNIEGKMSSRFLI